MSGHIVMLDLLVYAFAVEDKGELGFDEEQLDNYRVYVGGRPVVLRYGVDSPDQRTKDLLGILGMVRVVRPSDSNFKKGEVVTIEQFLRMVEGVLVNGGEMPIAQLESEGKV